MKNINDLKIEFRAVPYTISSHVLEYRLSPDQDLTYYREHSWFWGLIKFKTKSKYDCKWHQPTMFKNCVLSMCKKENADYHYLPIFINDKNELLYEYQRKFQTYGEFMKWYNDTTEDNIKKYRIERAKYLSNIGVWV